MNKTFVLLMGIAATVVASLLGLVAVPSWQMREMQPVEVTNSDGATALYPTALDDYEQEPGRTVYRSQGCIYCHSQQVRAPSFGSDIDRGWGERRSVPRDYLLQSPPLLGTMRTGPDVANIGARQPADAWHHLHLFDARLVTKGSIMPPYGFMYEVVESDPGERGFALPPSYRSKPAWIVPSRDALNLVAYLKALHQDHPLSEVQ